MTFSESFRSKHRRIFGFSRIRLYLWVLWSVVLDKALAQSVITAPNNTLNQSLLYPTIERADVILGALFPLHSLNKDQVLEDTCGPIQDEDGFLALEAALFALDQVNEDANLLPFIRLGLLALDSCNSPDIALHQSLRFIKGFIASQNAHHEGEFRCADNSAPVYREGHYDKVVGVIAGHHSSVSVQVANVLRLFKVPQISYRSTSASLSERNRYPYFLRTVPSDNNQAEVILKVLEYLGISYVSLVYSDTEYGRGGYAELVKKAKNTTVCFATPAFGLKLEDPKKTYEWIVKELEARKRAKVVVLFSDKPTSLKLFEAAKTSETKFLWVGSDAWATHTRTLEKYSGVIEGAIAIQPMAKTLPGFEEYFQSLNPELNSRNPWFKEYWENHFKCSLQTDPKCLLKDLKTSENYVKIEWLHFVRDSVYAFANGLNAMWKDRCKGVPGLCQEMAHNGHVHGDELFEYLRNVTFLDVSNQTFRFQSSGAGTARYTVYSYTTLSSSTLDNPWIKIANFSYDGDAVSLTFSEETKWRRNIPKSYCGRPCNSRQAKIPEEDSCCWRCEECLYYQYLNHTTKFCESCNVCQMPDKFGTSCQTKEEEYLNYSNQWAITSMAFAALGIISTIFVGVIFWVHIDTPVIRASSRELSYILLFGIFLSFLMTFVILAPPTPLTCGLSRFFLGFSYTLCYAAILTKTNRISRIFNKNPANSLAKTRYTSPQSQMVIVVLLVCVEVVINLSWLIYYQPAVKKICRREEERNTIICKGIDDISYMVGFIYPLFLVCLCTIYAIKTRKCPGGFNEARYIAFTNYTTCILWVVFVPLYVTTPAKDGVRVVSLAISLSLGAFVQLGCLFFQKVHIVLFKPEKNTRDAVMSQPRGPFWVRTDDRSASAMAFINGINAIRTTTVPHSPSAAVMSASGIVFSAPDNANRQTPPDGESRPN